MLKEKLKLKVSKLCSGTGTKLIIRSVLHEFTRPILIFCRKLKDYLKLNGVKYPAVILGGEAGNYTTLMNSGDLNACAGDPQAMVKELRQKKILTGPKATSSL